jgi:hypothetical protein
MSPEQNKIQEMRRFDSEQVTRRVVASDLLGDVVTVEDSPVEEIGQHRHVHRVHSDVFASRHRHVRSTDLA